MEENGGVRVFLGAILLALIATVAYFGLYQVPNQVVAGLGWGVFTGTLAVGWAWLLDKLDQRYRLTTRVWAYHLLYQGGVLAALGLFIYPLPLRQALVFWYPSWLMWAAILWVFRRDFIAPPTPQQRVRSNSEFRRQRRMLSDATEQEEAAIRRARKKLL